jgi:hypothetical protein
MQDNSTHKTTETKFNIFYRERRKIFDKGIDIGETEQVKRTFYTMADDFTKSDMYALIDEIKYLINSGTPTPISEQTIVKIERQLAKRTVINKAARWQLLMMMCDWMDELQGVTPRPVQRRTTVFTEAIQSNPQSNLYKTFE